MDTLGIQDTIVMLDAALDSDTPIHLIGSPGIGKSSIVGALAKKHNLPLEVLILSLCDPTDVGGFPVANNGALDRLPLGPIKRACDKPSILFLDELSCAPPAVQAASLQLIYGRQAGDRYLHPDTRIVAASNPSDQAAGGWDMALPLIGRLTNLKLRPLLSEVQEFFFALGKESSTLRNLAVDYAATLEADPSLLQVDPPPGAQSSGRPWGAPRSWHRALELCTALLDKKFTDTSAHFAAALAGNVGEDAAAAYMAIRKVRHKLPTIAEILDKPKDAKVPQDMATGCAVLGVVAQVAMKDPCAAYVYADRLNDEIRVAATRIMGRKEFGLSKHKANKLYNDAVVAQGRMLKGIGDIFRSGA